MLPKPRYSWLSAAELTGFDYDQTFTDQRHDTPKTVTYRGCKREAAKILALNQTKT
ncbi:MULTISPECIES: hypothetical protein [unclassified Photorhabdus]|uniref:hypothetical protein n=1 Tax=unclassified Photorhabdus TaxID=2620880 RepID=UPI0013141FB3|nr:MULTISPECIES: hypothetical protein [unclassified Photorhabdus]